MSSSSESLFTRNVRRFAHDVREIFLDFLRWDEEDETAAQAANISALEDPSSSSVKLPAGGWKLIQRKRKPTSIDFPAAQYDEDALAEILTFDLKVDNLNPQKALLDRIMRVTFDSPTPYGMDATWGGKPLHCKWTDISGRIGNRDSFTYPLLECDVTQSNYWEPMNIMVSEVNYENLMEHLKSLEDLWTEAIHTVYIFVDNRPLDDARLCPEVWKSFCPWMKARASTIGPLRERTTAIHIPICEVTGLHRVHFTWAGTFVLESLVYLFPDKHFVLIDTDCVPTSLFEIEELARLMWQRDTDVDMVDDEAKILSAVDPPCPSMVMLCTETKAEINAGLVIVTSCRRTRPFTRQDSTTDMVLGLLASRRDYVTSEEHAFDYESVAASGLLWTPLASCKACQPLHWTHAWALLGEWSGHILSLCLPLPMMDHTIGQGMVLHVSCSQSSGRDCHLL